MYVTTALPILIADTPWTTAHTLFCISRFTLIYAICILFDYRDREADRVQGVKSMITWMSEKNIVLIFLAALVLFAISTVALSKQSFSAFSIILLLIPGGIVLGLYNYARKHFYDYLYYFVLDGLMMFSSLLTLLFRI
jgi:4-hydroxybenzoate polyprenyltransferase